MSVQLVVEGVGDLIEDSSDLKWSNADPGGWEALSCGLRQIRDLRAGQRVRALVDGRQTWDGLIEDVSQRVQFGRPTYGLSAVGHGSLLKRTSYAQCYVDRDLSQWLPISATRKAALEGSLLDLQQNEAGPRRDDSGGPGIMIATIGQMGSTGRTFWGGLARDLGPLCRAGHVLATGVTLGTMGSGDTNLQVTIFAWDNDAASGEIADSERRAQGTTPWTFTLSASKRIVGWRWRYNVALAGGVGAGYWVFLRRPAIVGDHGLVLRGTSQADYGFWPTDVMADALKRMQGRIRPGNIEPADGYIVQHLLSLTPRPIEDWISESAKFVGYSWGIWSEAFDALPRLDAGPSPRASTAAVAIRDCADCDPPRARFSQLYDSARVSYTDAAGVLGYVTVTNDNPLLDEGQGSTLEIDSGMSSAAAATVFGEFALELAERAARGGGSATLPDSVMLPGGGSARACFLRSGQDRVMLNELGESFHVRRVETTVGKDRSLTTSIQFDGGADLSEVLAARKSVTDVLTAA